MHATPPRSVRSFYAAADGRLETQGEVSGSTAFTGRPYGLDGALPQFDPDGPATAIEAALARVDGRFSLVSVGERRIVAATDLVGVGGAYVAQTSSGTIVSSHLGHCAQRLSDRSFDPVGAAGVLFGGLCPGGRTPFAGVTRLMGGEYASIDRKTGRVEIRRYAQMADLVDGVHPAEPDELVALIRAGIDREDLGERPAVFFSSGGDSRALAMHAPADVAEQLLCLTYGGIRSRDRRYAADIARQIRRAHRAIGPRTIDPTTEARRLAHDFAGLAGMQTAQHFVPARSAVEHASAAMHGFLGDTVTGKSFIDDDERANARQLEWMLRPDDDAHPSHIRDARREVVRVLEAELADLRGLPPGRAATLLNIRYRQACRIGTTVRALDQEIPTATPFFYRPLLQYQLTARAEDLLDQRVYAQTLGTTGPANTSLRSKAWRVADSLAQRTGADRYATFDVERWPVKHRRWYEAVFDGDDSGIGEVGRWSIDRPGLRTFAHVAAPLLLAQRG